MESKMYSKVLSKALSRAMKIPEPVLYFTLGLLASGGVYWVGKKIMSPLPLSTQSGSVGHRSLLS